MQVSLHSYRGTIAAKAAEKTKKLSKSTVQAIRIGKVKMKSVVNFFGPTLGRKIHFHHDDFGEDEVLEKYPEDEKDDDDDDDDDVPNDSEQPSSSLVDEGDNGIASSPMKSKGPLSPSNRLAVTSLSSSKLLVARGDVHKKQNQNQKQSRVDVLIRMTKHWVISSHTYIHTYLSLPI